MAKVTRISVSIEQGLADLFDAYWEKQGIPTRSEAIKHLIRNVLVKQEWSKGEIIAGVVTIIYDHHKSGLLEKITNAQHNFGELVICSQHAQLDHHNCMENIIVRGAADRIYQFHQTLAAVKGMKHSTLSMTTTGKKLE